MYFKALLPNADMRQLDIKLRGIYWCRGNFLPIGSEDFFNYVHPPLLMEMVGYFVNRFV